MIAIVSSSARECTAFAALCESQDWTCIELGSVRAFGTQLARIMPAVVLTRHRLADGYSDDVFHQLSVRGLAGRTRLIVLLEASAGPTVEARQVTLGADYVHRDPVRSDVLIAYLTRFRRATQSPVRPANGPTPPATVTLAGAVIDPIGRTVSRGKKSVHVTPREIELAERLAASQGELVTYQVLYDEILGRRFSGDTSNMRVLVGRLAASLERVGCPLRRHIEVIPKLGYRHRVAAAR